MLFLNYFHNIVYRVLRIYLILLVRKGGTVSGWRMARAGASRSVMLWISAIHMQMKLPLTGGTLRLRNEVEIFGRVDGSLLGRVGEGVGGVDHYRLSKY